MAIHHAAARWIGMQAEKCCSAYAKWRRYFSNEGEAISGLKGDLAPFGRQNTAGTY